MRIDIIMEVYYNDKVQINIRDNYAQAEERTMKKRLLNFFTYWMTDIEVNKIAYNAIFCLLILGIVFIHQPIFEITTVFSEMAITTADIEGLSWINVSVTVLNIVSFASLLMPNLVPLEWKTKWVMPVTVTSILECGVIIYLVVTIKDSLGAVLNLLAMEVALTASGWALIATVVLTLICAIKVIWDIRNNSSY